MREANCLPKQEYKYSDITGKVIGAAMKVHNSIGVGFPEVIYQRALAIELDKTNLSFSREQSMPIYYNGEKIGFRRVDFLVEKSVLVELKAIGELETLNLVQVLNYLRLFRLEIGLLINFGARSLQFRRIIANNQCNQ